MTVIPITKRSRAVVIGAGLGGLAVALRLQGQGFEVTVLEQGSAPGGRAARLRDGGFTWDTGPSLITMPWVLEEAFAAGGLDLHSEVDAARLDPLYRIRWAGEERSLDFFSDVDRLREEIARFVGARRPRARRLPGRAQADLRGRASSAAGQQAFPSARSFAALVPSMVRLRAVLPLHTFVARHFRNPRVREAFSFHSLFIGGDPFRVPAIYGALVYLQLLDGGWYTDGGVYALVEAMARPLDVRCDAPRRARSRPRAGGVRGVWLRRRGADPGRRGRVQRRRAAHARAARPPGAAAAAAAHDVCVPALPRLRPALRRAAAPHAARGPRATATSSAT